MSIADDCRSVALKVKTYVVSASEEDHLHGLAEYAADLSRQGMSSTLSALSREIDTWLREVQAPSDALLIVAKMRKSGVLEKHLPVLPSARKLKAVADRGTVRTKAEAQLITAVFNNPALSQLLHTHESALGAALDAWQASRKRAEA